MPRSLRIGTAGVVHHVMNRGSRKGVLFERADDYTAFIEVVAEARELHPMRINAYCLMRTHWHFLMWPEAEGDLSRFMHWLTGTHAQRWRQSRASRGQGAVYQSRFVAKPIEDSFHLMVVWRYIERNPLEAGLVSRAELWPWSSMGAQFTNVPRIPVDPAPIALPPNWVGEVNAEELEDEMFERPQRHVEP